MVMIRSIVQHQHHFLTWVSLVKSHQQSVVQPLHVDVPIHVVVVVTVSLLCFIDQLTGEGELICSVVVDGVIMY